MAGHSKFANIKHRKAAVDKKRASTFSKHARAVATAAKLGGGDPGMNPRLALAIDKARADNMPKDNIERAIKKGTGGLEGVHYEEIRYEAYGPGGVAILIDALTDNRNRTVPELRSMLEKHGGSLAESGSVAWGFDAKSVIQVAAEGVDEEKLTEVIMELGAEDLRLEEDNYEIVGDSTLFGTIQTGLREAGYKIARGEISMLPQNTISIDLAAARKVLALLDGIDDLEDVQTTYSNVEISDEIIAKLNEEE